MEPATPRKSSRVGELDGLRGLAAVIVVFYHYMVGPVQKLPLLAGGLHLLEISPFSLDIFFILSGFLIGGILLHTRNRPDYYKTFYKRRVARIFPIYYIWLAVFVFIYLFAEGWGLWRPRNFSGAFYIASFALLFQNFFPSIVESSFFLAPTWTLVVEEHFYLIMPFVARRCSPKRMMQLLVGILIFAPLFRGLLFSYVGHRSDWATLATYMLPPCRADALAIGVLLAMAWAEPGMRAWLQKRVSLFFWAMFPCFATAIAFSSTAARNLSHSKLLNASVGHSIIEFSCLCVILIALCKPQGAFGRFLNSGILRGFGRVSYCMYLVHWGVYWMIFRFVLHMKFGERLWLDFAIAPIAFLISWGIAELSWNYVESPIMKWASGSTKPSYPRAIPVRQTQPA